jgi:hypothetical protein
MLVLFLYNQCKLAAYQVSVGITAIHIGGNCYVSSWVCYLRGPVCAAIVGHTRAAYRLSKGLVIRPKVARSDKGVDPGGFARLAA